jgi:16S rRNA (adenine1518-N6/adenine1519-N6)-dimethyltransferase
MAKYKYKLRQVQENRGQSKFAKKDLGQNFLNDPILRDKIIDLAGDIKSREILEVGPGLGFLTEEILRRGANLTAVELDERSVDMLNKKFSQKSNLDLIQGSILDQDLDEIFEQKKYSVIANIPYHITAPILRKVFAETKNKPEIAILMVQKEVAEKISRKKAGQEKIVKGRSILSIAVEIFAEIENCFVVDRTMFSPAPKVDSAIIRLKSREKLLIPIELEKDFFTVVRAGFSEKRKKLGNHIGKFFGIDSAKLLGNVSGDKRAETLTIEEWIEISRNFTEFKDEL